MKRKTMAEGSFSKKKKRRSNGAGQIFFCSFLAAIVFLGYMLLAPTFEQYFSPMENIGTEVMLSNEETKEEDKGNNQDQQDVNKHEINGSQNWNDELIKNEPEHITGIAELVDSTKSSAYSADSCSGALDQKEQRLYQVLTSKVKDIAEGRQTSTSLEIEAEQIGVGTPKTASELGVREIASDGHISQEAMKAIIRFEDVDYQKVLEAMLISLPYDLFWYNKSAATTLIAPQIQANHNGSEYTCRIKSVKIELPVSSEYAASLYQVAPEAIEKAKLAKENALAIVEQCSDMSDQEKLYAYKEAICQNTSYDSNAGNELDANAYGGPWQMINVFDGNEDTKTVCEGYSKAMKFLCDNTVWSHDIKCHIVNGTLCSDGDVEGHMWNVIQIDGDSYLADITNSDEDSLGQKEALFLKTPTEGDVDNGYVFVVNGQKVRYEYGPKIPTLLDPQIINLCRKDTDDGR